MMVLATVTHVLFRQTGDEGGGHEAAGRVPGDGDVIFLSAAAYDTATVVHYHS